ncbi:MAG: ATP-dependent zinc metalloprotease FtsH [Lachnospiraceae bacterium]|nr:ATP-dependent zinc metalloprotease FtsH [Lachnospiraceae bacterium]
MNKTRNYNGYFAIVFLLLAVFIVLEISRDRLARTDETYTLGQLMADAESGNVEHAVITPNAEAPTGAVQVDLKGGTRKVLYATDVTEVEHLLREEGIDPEVRDVPGDNLMMMIIWPVLIAVVVIALIVVMMNNNAGAQGAGSRMMNFGKSRAKMANAEENPIKLSDVAGLKEEKEQLEEIVTFLKAPGKFTKVGARIPKGILLEGAPGTGKTLLARAIAGEAGVPFFTISGSDFVEMFVGVGASRVRDLFADAKKNAPCIVFIDEIDAVARRRGTGMGGGHDEREQTLNQLLVEMDGFGVNEGIIVMAATNRVDILDPAIMRPGRFDRKIAVARPDIGGREDILKVHARNKPLSEDVDLRQIAQTTAGFTGADLENLLNESAIRAAMQDRTFITQDDIRKAFVQVGIGTEKRSRIISDEEKKITAYHETGHAILFHVLPDVGPVYTVSIIPTGLGAAGYTMPLPEKDEMFITRSKMLQDIMVTLGGRIAEEIIFGDITTGASSDIRKVTQAARGMVMRYGMSMAIGTINYDEQEDDVFLGYDLGHAKKNSELVAGRIDEEVKKIVDACYAKAREIILGYMDVLHAGSALLMEKEKIGREEFEALFDNRTETADIKDLLPAC